MKRYPAYKASGVEWLGEVPEGWKVLPLKQLLELSDGGVWGEDPTGIDDTLVLRSTEQTEDGEWVIEDPAARKLSSEEVSRFQLGIGDILITKSSGSAKHIGKATLVDDLIASMHCCYSNFMQRIRFYSNIYPKFIWYILNNPLARNQFDFLSSSTTGLANLTGTTIGQIKVPIGQQSEQRAIAAFLDRETAKIDALVAEQRRLVALLAEKRQAVISHAVTRGLNSDAPLKPSGIDWLGDIPERWEVMPIRKVARLESGHTPSRSRPEWWVDCHIPWFSLADIWQIRPGRVEYVFETTETVSELGLENSSARLLPARTVMLSRTASVGFSAIMGVPMSTTQDFANWVCGNRLLPEFLLYCLRGMPSEFDRLKMGSTHNTIYMPDIQQLAIALPPLEEQKAIVGHVRAHIGKMDGLIDAATTAITLLQERRAALISAAVTGKIDVRDLAPQDISENLEPA